MQAAEQPAMEAAVKLQSNRHKRLKKAYRQKYLFLMIMPAIILIFVFHYIPLAGWLIAFKNYQIGISLWKVPWAGLDYFKMFFLESADYIYLIRNTLVMNISVIVLNLTVAMIFAILLNEVRHSWFKKIIQTVSFFPFFVSWVIVYAIIHALMAESTGAINVTLIKHGIIEQGINVLGDKAYSWVLIIFVMGWKYLGYNGVIYLASIASIPSEQYEAAAIDGAGRFGKIWYITIPNLMPTLIILLIMNVGWVLNSDFELFYLFTNPTNWETMEVLDMYIYKFGLTLGNFPYATAVGIIKTIISLLLVIGANALSKKVTNKSLL
ncbi:ABC transporter permease [Paenibacillus spongiae]|uniref:ABC transporter permease subunit n=1 Tax=Paenibacillus spongiae TaxID=2909671 RepID=A0ABY5S6H6_9BACL|nr:ABC transporter permease subunit [Paenibacillus spongiae]UVI28452.1 ABC transporter permease subunit [Paenibacillus spongiae]